MKFILSSKYSLALLLPLILLSFKCGNNASAPIITTTPEIKVASFLSEQQFNNLFPMRDKFYTYAAFIKAVNELGQVQVKVSRRAASVYQFTPDR